MSKLAKKDIFLILSSCLVIYLVVLYVYIQDLEFKELMYQFTTDSTYINPDIPAYKSTFHYSLIICLPAIGGFIIYVIADLIKYQWSRYKLKTWYTTVHLPNDEFIEDLTIHFDEAKMVACKVTDEMFDELEKLEIHDEFTKSVIEGGIEKIEMESSLISDQLLKGKKSGTKILDSLGRSLNSEEYINSKYNGIKIKPGNDDVTLGIPNVQAVCDAFIPSDDIIKEYNNQRKNLSDERIDELIETKFVEEIEEKFGDEEFYSNDEEFEGGWLSRIFNKHIRKTEYGERKEEVKSKSLNLGSKTVNILVEPSNQVKEFADLKNRKREYARKLVERATYDFSELLLEKTREFDSCEVYQIKLDKEIILISDEDYKNLSNEELTKREKTDKASVIFVIIPGTYKNAFKYHTKSIHDPDRGCFFEMNSANVSLKLLRYVIVTDNGKIPLFQVTDTTLLNSSMFEMKINMDLIKDVNLTVYSFMVYYALLESNSHLSIIQNLKAQNVKVETELEELRNMKLLEALEKGHLDPFLDEIAQERVNPSQNISNSKIGYIFLVGLLAMTTSVIFYLLNM
jgi:hypothetical protein